MYMCFHTFHIRMKGRTQQMRPGYKSLSLQLLGYYPVRKVLCLSWPLTCTHISTHTHTHTHTSASASQSSVSSPYSAVQPEHKLSFPLSVWSHSVFRDSVSQRHIRHHPSFAFWGCLSPKKTIFFFSVFQGGFYFVLLFCPKRVEIS